MNKHTFQGQTIDLDAMSAAELLPIFNAARKCLKMDPISRFADTKTARRRTDEILKSLKDSGVVDAKPAKADKPAPAKAAPKADKPAPAPAAKKTAAKVEKTARATRGTNLVPPGHAPLPCREGSKQALLVDLLSKPNGATMNELLAGLSGGNKPWTEASVRAGFGWDMKQKGYGVKSEFDADGTERFHLVLPVIKGATQAVPTHTALKGKPKADARQSRLAAV